MNNDQRVHEWVGRRIATIPNNMGGFGPLTVTSPITMTQNAARRPSLIIWDCRQCTRFTSQVS